MEQKLPCNVDSSVRDDKAQNCATVFIFLVVHDTTILWYCAARRHRPLFHIDWSYWRQYQKKWPHRTWRGHRSFCRSDIRRWVIILFFGPRDLFFYFHLIGGSDTVGYMQSFILLQRLISRLEDCVSDMFVLIGCCASSWGSEVRTRRTLSCYRPRSAPDLRGSTSPTLHRRHSQGDLQVNFRMKSF